MPTPSNNAASATPAVPAAPPQPICVDLTLDSSDDEEAPPLPPPPKQTPSLGTPTHVAEQSQMDTGAIKKQISYPGEEETTSKASAAASRDQFYQQPMRLDLFTDSDFNFSGFIDDEYGQDDQDDLFNELGDNSHFSSHSNSCILID